MMVGVFVLLLWSVCYHIYVRVTKFIYVCYINMSVIDECFCDSHIEQYSVLGSLFAH